jgi:hypothetical protein
MYDALHHRLNEQFTGWRRLGDGPIAAELVAGHSPAP